MKEKNAKARKGRWILKRTYLLEGRKGRIRATAATYESALKLLYKRWRERGIETPFCCGFGTVGYIPAEGEQLSGAARVELCKQAMERFPDSMLDDGGR